jgi:hypothetical protein
VAIIEKITLLKFAIKVNTISYLDTTSSTYNNHLMSKCNFSIAYNGSSDELIERARKAITGAGGQFFGNAKTGEFSLSTFIGKISGNYNATPAKLEITITDKPVFISCSKIQEELEKYLQEF